ncbi:hypothetical protein G9A89_013787 [Geosiphon pyriformis]|nr:hypothetical protein G9A89_013787 [Geosiphon pyriformis]
MTVSFPLGSINYNMEEEEEVSLPPLEVAMKKSFTLDINLLAVEEKLATAKTQVIRKLFSGINGFGGATTPSKFEGIIRSTFMSEESMERATLLAREKGIIVNSDLKRQGIRSDWATVVEFAKSEQAVQLASKWLFLIRKNSVCVTMAVGDHETWTSRDQFRALLFTLLVRTTAHDLGNLLKKADGKTCIINWSFEIDNRVRCAVVGFNSKEKLEAAFCTELIFGSVRLSWAIGLVRCEKCGRFGHSALECDASDVSVSAPSIALKKERHVFSADYFYLAKLYAKKNVPISHPAAFGGKFWAQMVSLASSAGGSPSGSGFGFGLSLSSALGLVGGVPSFPIDGSPLDAWLASLKRSLELLADQVSGILRKLNFVELVSMVPSSNTPSLVGSVPVAPVLDSDMVLDNALTLFSPLLSNTELDVGFSSSSSKVLTTKVGGLKSKMLALEALVGSEDVICWHRDSGNLFDGMQIFSSGLDKGFVGAEIAIIMNSLLARHVSKIEEISSRVILVCLLFKDKLSVTVLGLYAGASPSIHFRQASEVNSFIAKAVNTSNFVVLGGNFNKNESGRSASYGFCLGLGLVNLLVGHQLAKTSTWSNSRGIEKTIDYILVSKNLSFAVAKHWIGSVSEFFNTDHKAVMVLVGLGRLLDVQLNSLSKQTNKDHWKFKIKDADASKWSEFRDCVSAKLLLIKDLFFDAKAGSNLDIINKYSSKFFGLELLVAKIVGVVRAGDVFEVDCLMRKWSTLDEAKAYAFSDLI